MASAESIRELKKGQSSSSSVTNSRNKAKDREETQNSQSLATESIDKSKEVYEGKRGGNADPGKEFYNVSDVLKKDTQDEESIKIKTSWEESSFYYLNETFSDANLILNRTRIPVHKPILASRCNFFKSLFLKNKSQEQFIISNAQLTPFCKILKYIYTGSISINPSDVGSLLDVLQLAKDYELDDLQNSIKQKIPSLLNSNNTFEVLNKSNDLNFEAITDMCYSFIRKDAAKILKHDLVSILTQKSILELLRRQSFEIPEIEIFRFVQKWCERNEDIGGLVMQCVRLNRLTVEDIFSVVKPSRLVDSNILLNVLEEIKEQQSKKVSGATAVQLTRDITSVENTNAGLSTENESKKLSQMELTDTQDLVIGIYLGNTNYCVSIFRNRKMEIVENCDGHRITPSFIFFDENGSVIIGEGAKRLAGVIPERVIFGVKMLIGRKFQDSFVQNNLLYLPFKIVENSDGDPLVVIDTNTMKTPQQLCTMILKKLKNDAEAKLGCTITKTVITVPAYFNVRQKEVTLAAAKEAGFTVLKLLNEPIAVALSHYFRTNPDGISTSIVFNLGTFTFDVSILKRDSDKIEILGVDGDTQLGGLDFNNLIADYVSETLKRDYDYDIKNDKSNLATNFHVCCEEAKEVLSKFQDTGFILPGMLPNRPWVQVKFSRQQFETLADDLFKRTIEIVDRCLKRSSLNKNDINEIILVGGSTHIRKIQQMVTQYFDRYYFRIVLNRDECVAEGAALQAAMLSKNKKQKFNGLV